jgi:cytochrome bd-type quinol oxidase subunit 2
MSVNTKNIPVVQKDDSIISYLLLRQLIGILGILLPFSLTLGAYLVGHCSSLQPSISHYYFSTMHIVFVGTLCVLGGFLITYRGKGTLENRTSNIAGACAFSVAIFPTSSVDFINPVNCNCRFITLNGGEVLPSYIKWLHYGFAAILFICFIIFCLKIFQKSDLDNPDPTKKERRNAIYKACGIIIIASIVAIATIAIYDYKTDRDNFPYSTFIFETTSLLPFGFSWLLKGSVNWPNSKSRMVAKSIKYLR